MRRETITGVLCGFLASTAWTRGAVAQFVPACDSLSLPRPIYGAGGSALTATFGRVAQALSALPEPITILYSDPSECAGFSGFLDRAVKGTFWYWTATGEQKSCAVDPVRGQEVDFAHAYRGVDCLPGGLPPDVGEYLGPVHTLSIVTGPNSPESAISAEALYFIYGFGAAGQVTPWVNDAQIIGRPPSSAASRLLGEAIGVAPALFKGNILLAGVDTLSEVVKFSAVSPDSAIGYLAGATASKARTQIKTLAYQARGQTCGYWPDSTPMASDMANVRNGQYALWTPFHFYARRAEASDAPAHEGVARLLRWFDGTETPPAGVDVIGATIDTGIVPLCAMRVMKPTISGALSSWAPPVPCTHFFEQRATGAPSGVSCSDDAKCERKAAGSRCRFGFCEAY
jgi:hypothetical protein